MASMARAARPCAARARRYPAPTTARPPLRPSRPTPPGAPALTLPLAVPPACSPTFPRRRQPARSRSLSRPRPPTRTRSTSRQGRPRRAAPTRQARPRSHHPKLHAANLDDIIPGRPYQAGQTPIPLSRATLSHPRRGPPLPGRPDPDPTIPSYMQRISTTSSEAAPTKQASSRSHHPEPAYRASARTASPVPEPAREETRHPLVRVARPREPGQEANVATPVGGLDRHARRHVCRIGQHGGRHEGVVQRM